VTIKLTETQVTLIRAATQRDDRLFTFPEGRRKAAAQQAASQLLAAGVAREVQARGEAPVWRRDNESQCAFALKLTAVGAKAIASVAVNGSKGDARLKSQVEVEAAPSKDARRSRRNEKPIATEQPPVVFAAPRCGTKIDNVVKMLSRPEGATLDALVKATGWLPHTTYAALTGLRKRGYALERSRNDGARPSVYRLSPPSPAGA
jgi:Protein of unknown function (DUF3489)